MGRHSAAPPQRMLVVRQLGGLFLSVSKGVLVIAAQMNPASSLATAVVATVERFPFWVRARWQEVVPRGVEIEVAVLPPRPLWLGAFRAMKTVQDRRIRHEEGTGRGGRFRCECGVA